MAYIGNAAQTAFTSFDKQTITGDGTAVYTLSHSVANDQEVEVFVNNVRQEGGTGKAYTVSGNQITFTENIASTDDCYVVFQGKALQTVVPPAGSVTDSMITGLSSSKLTGALPALDASALTNLPGATVSYGAGSGGTTNTYTENSKSYKSHTFTSSGTFTVTTAGHFDIMMVGGGGGGGGHHAGGGGAGNVVIINDTISAGSYSLVIGAGGTSSAGGRGTNGTDTTGFGETAYGGGGGGDYAAGNGGGASGGCGGAASGIDPGMGGAGTSGKLKSLEGFRYGNPAGNSYYTNHDGGGGGGAGEKGEEARTTSNGGDGGDGIGNTYRTGSSVNYGGGGGGGTYYGSSGTVGVGGAGGGGNGSYGNAYNATSGSANTGGGGGGNGGQTGGAGGSGGSGIIVIRYEV